MIKSMTGFGRGNVEQAERGFVVEMKSVNHRYFDINIRMPKSLFALEDKIRKTIQEKVNRGKIDVFITQNNSVKESTIAVFNEKLADSYVDCLKEIKARYGAKDDLSVTQIAKFPDVITLSQQEEDIDGLWSVLQKSLNDAIDMLVKMRECEGEKLKTDALIKCSNIKAQVDEIEKKAPNVTVQFREKLMLRLNEVIQNTNLDENRIAMEVALLGDKTCIDEEIVRLNSHLIQMKDTLDLNEPIGRKADFIVQEMNREANTIASKANDINITNIVLNIKTDIEKIREQIQNIE